MRPRYFIDDLEMEAVRVEPAFTLLRSDDDKVRWISNEYLATFPPVNSFTRATRKGGVMVLIEGPAHSGKTFLAESFEKYGQMQGMPRYFVCDDAIVRDKGIYARGFSHAGIAERVLHGDVAIVVTSELVPAHLYEEFALKIYKASET